MTPTARARVLYKQVAEEKLRYIDEHKFRVVGKRLECPGLRVGTRRVDSITFSSEALAQQAWVAIGNHVMAALLEKKALWATSRRCYSSHTAARDRRRDWFMASQLRSWAPTDGYPLAAYNEILRAAGFPEIR